MQVRAPTVAEYLNRDDIVLDNHDNRLHLARNAAWAEPLAGAIARNLVLDLGQRLPGSSVYTTDSGIASKPDAVVDIVISQFAEDGFGQAEIAATMSVHRPDAAGPDLRQVHVMAALKDASVGALAASLSQALGQLADHAADDLRMMGNARAKPAATGHRS